MACQAILAPGTIREERLEREHMNRPLRLADVIYGPGDTSTVRTTFIQYLKRKLSMIPSRTAFSWAHVDGIARGHILACAE
jgi:hypothetical protein